MSIDKLKNTIKQGFDAVIAFVLSRQFIEYSIIAILAVGWVIKLILWFTPSSILQANGVHVNYLIVETAAAFVLGLALLAFIAYQRNVYSNEKLFWGSAIAAAVYSTSILLVLLVLGILGKYFGLKLTDTVHPETVTYIFTAPLALIS